MGLILQSCKRLGFETFWVYLVMEFPKIAGVGVVDGGIGWSMVIELIWSKV